VNVGQAIERQSREVVASATDFAIITIDLDGRVIGWNHGAERLLGYTEAEILGRSADVIFTPEDRAAGAAEAERCTALRDGAAEDERWHLRSDGSRFWGGGTLMSLKDGSGTVTDFVKCMRDRTAQRQTEAALVAANQRLRLAIEASRLAVWDLDVVTNTLAASPELNLIMGFAPEVRPTADDTRRNYAPSELERLEGLFAEAFARGETLFEFEFRYIRPDDGVERWLLLRAELLLDEAGQPVRLVGVLMDIDEGKRSQLALQETEERFRLIADSAPVMLWMGTPEGRCLYLNAAQRAFWGVAEEDVVGFDWTPTIHPEDLAMLAGPWAEGMRSRTSFTVEARYRRADGAWRLLQTTTRPRFDAAGEFLGMTGVNIDITDQRQAEAELQGLNATLEARVAEALAERAQTEEQLRQAQKMEAVGQLTGGIAHDFNNLLAGIVGSLDLLQTRLAQGRTTDLARYVGAAMTSAQRAAALTHRLLAFARRQPLDPKPVEANRLVADMEDLLRRTLGPAISLEMVTGGGLWRTLCDPVQLESALLNLCINARDAMPDGGRLTIETANAHLDDAYAASQREVTPGQYVAISVTDTGTGMSPELMAHVFEPFFTTKPTGQGTGLGLSMVYGFAKQSDGHVRIYSEEGQGTTVKLDLPRHRGMEGHDEADPEFGQVPRAESGETVLVVEDEPVVRGLVVEVLEELGYRALEAPDGPSGLRLLLSKRRIDLLITDVGLPGLNGRQLADQARERRPDLKVLFITGYAENATLANGILEPGMAMLTKPFAVDALTRKIGQLIER
jgi:PAS domain S-box-containing protein